MKIKCPFCKHIYDPEAQNNTCPACNKKLLVSVFKKTAAKPGAAPVKRQVVSKPATTAAAPVSAPPPAEAKKAVTTRVAAPVSAEARKATTTKVAPPAAAEARKATTTKVAAPAVAAAPVRSGLDVTIAFQRGASEYWDTVIRVPLQVFGLANLIPARVREAITSEGIDLEELRKAVAHTDHIGPLLDIQTQAGCVRIAIELHR